MSAAESESTTYSLELLENLEEIYNESDGIFRDGEDFNEYSEVYFELMESVREEYKPDTSIEVTNSLKTFDFEDARESLQKSEVYEK